ncbi:hypothetical protein BD779DRAFT_1467785 [Infundibulicybe gibba]|nr:hypothetical protein BD779DRAFT_1467785 [Infundibulicybe gibba]
MYDHLILAAGSSLGSAILGAVPALAAWKTVLDFMHFHTLAQAENATTGVIYFPDPTNVPPVPNKTSGGPLCGVAACTTLAAIGPASILTRNKRKKYKTTPPPPPPSNQPKPDWSSFSGTTITNGRDEDAGGSGDPPPPPPPPSSEPVRLPEDDKPSRWDWLLLTLVTLNEVLTKRHRTVGPPDETITDRSTLVPRVDLVAEVCPSRTSWEVSARKLQSWIILMLGAIRICVIPLISWLLAHLSGPSSPEQWRFLRSWVPFILALKNNLFMNLSVSIDWFQNTSHQTPQILLWNPSDHLQPMLDWEKER